MKKKILCAILAVVSCVLILTACGNNYKWGPVSGGPAAGDTVTNNGGMVVQKGEYIYFINGMVDAGKDNTFGKPVMGAICRRKVSDTGEDADVIVPKIIVNSYTETGLFISGEYIYYATPSTDRATNGEVQKSYTDFMRTKLDGTGTERIAKVNPYENNTDGVMPYKFFEKDGKVSFVYVIDGKIHSVDASDKKFKNTTLAENVISSLFSDTEIFFTQKQMKKNNKEEDEELGYNKILKVAFTAGSEPVDITPDPINTESASENFTYTLKKVSGGVLFFTKTRTLNFEKGLLGYNLATGQVKVFTNNDYSEFLCVSYTGGLFVVDNDKLYYMKSAAPADQFTVFRHNYITLYRLVGNELYLGLRDTSFGDQQTASHVYKISDITALSADNQLFKSDLVQLTLNPIVNYWLKPDIIGDYIYFINTVWTERHDDSQKNEDYEYFLFRATTKPALDEDGKNKIITNKYDKKQADITEEFIGEWLDIKAIEKAEAEAAEKKNKK